MYADKILDPDTDHDTQCLWRNGYVYMYVQQEWMIVRTAEDGKRVGTVYINDHLVGRGCIAMNK